MIREPVDDAIAKKAGKFIPADTAAIFMQARTA
jgi:hypothetical protein